MALKEIRTYKDIQDAVLRRSKLNDVTDVRDDIKEKINTLYQHISFKRAYVWSGESRDLTLKKRESTGTITVTNGSNIVTGSGTAFVELDHRFAKIKIDTERAPLKIVRVASSTELTLESPWPGDSGSGKAYTIYNDEYGLYPDLQNIRKLTMPGVGIWKHITPESPETIDMLRYRNPFRAGIPERYTINGLSHYTNTTWATFKMGTDFWESSLDDKPKNKNLIIWPGILTSDRIAKIRYTKLVAPLGSDDDEPLIPYENRTVLVFAALAELFLQNRDLTTHRVWDRKYKDLLKEMESDVETVDDELILNVDRRPNRRSDQQIWRDDEIIND